MKRPVIFKAVPTISLFADIANTNLPKSLAGQNFIWFL